MSERSSQRVGAVWELRGDGGHLVVLIVGSCSDDPLKRTFLTLDSSNHFIWPPGKVGQVPDRLLEQTFERIA